MDELLGSQIDVNKYTNLIEKIKKNKIFIDFLKLNHSNIDIETLSDDEIFDMFKQYMVSNKENISSQSVNTNTNTPSKLNINMNSLNTIVSKNYNKADKYIKNMLTPQNFMRYYGLIINFNTNTLEFDNNIIIDYD